MIEVRALQPGDDRSRFRSGDPDLDRFFIRYAGQNQFRHHLGVTYVAIDDGAIIGFATVAASHVEAEALPNAATQRRIPYPLPVLRLARLAVDERSQGHGVGRDLLRFVFRLAHDMSGRVGCAGVLVDAKADATAFYEQYGFIRMPMVQGELGDRPLPRPMFVSLGSVPRPA